MDWLIAIAAYLTLVGGLTIIVFLRRPPLRQPDPRAYETHNPEVADWISGLHRGEH
jgi:hypothetical protein